jgi:hypothetical protein
MEGITIFLASGRWIIIKIVVFVKLTYLKLRWQKYNVWISLNTIRIKRTNICSGRVLWTLSSSTIRVMDVCPMMSCRRNPIPSVKEFYQVSKRVSKNRAKMPTNQRFKASYNAKPSTHVLLSYWSTARICSYFHHQFLNNPYLSCCGYWVTNIFRIHYR